MTLINNLLYDFFNLNVEMEKIKNDIKSYQRRDNNTICTWYHSAVRSYLRKSTTLVNLLYWTGEKYGRNTVRPIYYESLHIRKWNLLFCFHTHFIPNNIFFKAISIYTEWESLFAFRNGMKGMCYFTDHSGNIAYVFFTL